MKFLKNSKYFPSKYRLQNLAHFIQASMFTEYMNEKSMQFDVINLGINEAISFHSLKIY